MKKLLMCTALTAAVLMSAGSAVADELWNPHLRGTDEGLAAGALPPAGVYFINDSYFGAWKQYDGSGNANGNKLDLMVDIPIVLWNPGIKILGASYAMALAQPFDYTSTYFPSMTTTGNGHLGTFNTVVVPAMLSWALPSDFHVKTGLSVFVDDASSSPAYPASSSPASNAGAGNSFWTFEPELGVSWLHSGWNLSADMRYDHNLKDTKTNYDSGDQIAVDYTVTKELGKWTVGVGAYQENQLQRDVIDGVSTAGTSRQTYGAGPIVGYNFGPVNVSATYNYNILTQNDFGGDLFNVRVVAPLY